MLLLELDETGLLILTCEEVSNETGNCTVQKAVKAVQYELEMGGHLPSSLWA